MMQQPDRSGRFLLIDNFDSFTYNLVQYLGELGIAVDVCRNNALTASQAIAERSRCHPALPRTGPSG